MTKDEMLSILDKLNQAEDNCVCGVPRTFFSSAVPDKTVLKGGMFACQLNTHGVEKFIQEVREFADALERELSDVPFTVIDPPGINGGSVTHAVDTNDLRKVLGWEALSMGAVLIDPPGPSRDVIKRVDLDNLIGEVGGDGQEI